MLGLEEVLEGVFPTRSRWPPVLVASPAVPGVVPLIARGVDGIVLMSVQVGVRRSLLYRLLEPLNDIDEVLGVVEVF